MLRKEMTAILETPGTREVLERLLVNRYTSYMNNLNKGAEVSFSEWFTGLKPKSPAPEATVSSQ
jgi:hypothetical protein